MLIPTRTNTCIGNHKWFPVGYGGIVVRIPIPGVWKSKIGGGEKTRRRVCPSCGREKEKNSRDIRGAAIRRRNLMGEVRVCEARCWKTTRETLFDRTLCRYSTRGNAYSLSTIFVALDRLQPLLYFNHVIRISRSVHKFAGFLKTWLKRICPRIELFPSPMLL